MTRNCVLIVHRNRDIVHPPKGRDGTKQQPYKPSVRIDFLLCCVISFFAFCNVTYNDVVAVKLVTSTKEEIIIILYYTNWQQRNTAHKRTTILLHRKSVMGKS